MLIMACHRPWFVHADMDDVCYPGIVIHIFPFHSQRSSGKILNRIFIRFIKGLLLQWERDDGNTALEEGEMSGNWQVFQTRAALDGKTEEL